MTTRKPRSGAKSATDDAVVAQVWQALTELPVGASPPSFPPEVCAAARRCAGAADTKAARAAALLGACGAASDAAKLRALLKKSRDETERAAILVALGAHAARHGVRALEACWEILDDSVGFGEKRVQPSRVERLAATAAMLWAEPLLLRFEAFAAISEAMGGPRRDFPGGMLLTSDLATAKDLVLDVDTFPWWGGRLGAHLVAACARELERSPEDLAARLDWLESELPPPQPGKFFRGFVIGAGVERAFARFWGRDDDAVTLDELDDIQRTILRRRVENGRTGGLRAPFGVGLIDAPGAPPGCNIRRYLRIDEGGPLDLSIEGPGGRTWPVWRWLHELGRGLEEAALRPHLEAALPAPARVTLAREVALRIHARTNEGLGLASPRAGLVLRLLDDTLASGADAPPDLERIRANLAAAEIGRLRGELLL